MHCVHLLVYFPIKICKRRAMHISGVCRIGVQPDGAVPHISTCSSSALSSAFPLQQDVPMATRDFITCYNKTSLVQQNHTTAANYTIPAKDFNCDRWYECTCPLIDADPDVAGIGVGHHTASDTNTNSHLVIFRSLSPSLRPQR
jgi:hypothetical protein